jgi:hypothetical protein
MISMGFPWDTHDHGWIFPWYLMGTTIVSFLIKKVAGFTKSVKLTNPHPWGLWFSWSYMCIHGHYDLSKAHRLTIRGSIKMGKGRKTCPPPNITRYLNIDPVHTALVNSQGNIQKCSYNQTSNLTKKDVQWIWLTHT